MSQTSAPVDLDLGGTTGRRVGLAKAQLSHLFPPADFPIHLGYGPPPAGFRQVEAWRVVPDRRSPRFLVPPDPVSAARLVLSHNALRPPAVALTRRAAALAMRPLAALQGEHGLLRLSVPEGIDERAVEDGVVTVHLARRVPAAVATALSLRDFHPRAKPTVQLADADGRVAAFAKVASDPATGVRVSAEADLLARFGAALAAPAGGSGDAGLTLPRVLDVGGCGPFTYSVVEPLPDTVRRVGPDQDESVLRALAAFTGALGGGRAALGATTWWQAVYERVESAREARALRPDLVDGLLRLADAVAARDSDREVAVGCYHGDWVPWNLARDAATGRLWAWDLEYGAVTGPAGLDALRWVFQVQHVVHKVGFGLAAAAMAEAAPELLPALDLDPALAPLLVRLHVLETMATALTLLASGRGLPRGLDPDAVTVMATWQP